MIHKILIFVNKIKNDLKYFDENDYGKMFIYYNKLSEEISNEYHDKNIIKYDKIESKGSKIIWVNQLMMQMK